MARSREDPLETLQILAPDGSLVGDPPIDAAETTRVYRAMVGARLYDRKCMAMQKLGRLVTYTPYEGQEAVQIGAPSRLRRDDWLAATYRDAAMMWFHGYPRELLLLGRMGDERGGSPPEDVHALPPSITVGAHMLHAVGLAWAERLQGRDRVALTAFGDGATSEGDFHEALNFAGVFRAAVVFVCQNNGWAISTPFAKQSASGTIAQRGAAYDVPAERIDGNDLFAVVAAVGRAVDRARAGEGPSLIEALTYRMGPHSTTDDARRYRGDDAVAPWRERDPVERVRRHLEAQGAWDAAGEDALVAEEREAVESAVSNAEGMPAPAPEEMFGMYAERTPALEAQRRELLERELLEREP
jgi:2-oxoisovalerate dehydrogenase E1 component alpha subunit